MDKPKRKPEDKSYLKIAGCILLCIPVLCILAGVILLNMLRFQPDYPDYAFLMPTIESSLNASRAQIPDEISDDLLMPEKVGNFIRDDRESLSRNGAHLNGSANYRAPNEGIINLSLWYPEGWSLDQVWNNHFTGTACGDYVGRIYANKNWHLPYGYGGCSSINMIEWINHGWAITIWADSKQSTPDNLLNFLAAYPY